MAGTAAFGVTGLAVMGANLARNMARNGFEVAVHNRTQAKTDQLLAEHGDDGEFVAAASATELVAALAQPRRILVMVKAGPPVDKVIDEFAPLLDPGDVLIDGGNSFFADTRRRETALKEQGLLFVGAGVSGGEDGALNGPSIMPGGAPEAYAAVEEVFTTIAAQVDGTPCCTHIGPDAAGHYVKMVHNGIEYADMQLLAEAYDLLRTGLSLKAPELAAIFEEWNRGDLESFLVQSTALVLRTPDPATGEPLVDVILDEAEQKGTGRWTVESALELGVPVPAIAEAVFGRALSARKDERTAASKVLAGPHSPADVPDSFAEDVRSALYASKVAAYAQGFEQMLVAGREFSWDIHLGMMATIWRGGCIIRAKFLDRIREAYEAQPDLVNLLFADYFRDAVDESQDAWRRVVATGAQLGVPMPAFSSSLAYYDGYRRESGPANLIQALRDSFGAHTYRRTDRDGVYHTNWHSDGSEVRTDTD